MRLRIPNLVSRPNEVPVVAETATGSDVEVAGAQEMNEKSGTQTQVKSKFDDEGVSPEVQHGVQVAQAINQVWSREHLIAAYIIIWIINFIQGFGSGITGTLTPYVTSSFQAHSLTATTSIISSLISGLWKLPYAKILDVWGRPQGFALMVASTVLGFVMMAGCNNVTTYCAAQVFYQLGYSAIDFTITIFVADTSSLRNRAWWIAYTASPWLIVTWCYGPATNSVLETIGFRWGFGIWAIVYPIVCAPLFWLMWHNMKKAEKQGLIPKYESGRNWKESIYYYAVQFDVIGILLIATGLSLFLLSFSLYSYQAEQWKSPMIICFLVFGIILMFAFSFWEAKVAPVTFIPWHLMRDRTVIFTFAMVAAIYSGYSVWYDYFYSMLIVVFNTSVRDATYILNIYTIGATFWCLVVGVVIRYNGRLKWIALYFGVPVNILGVGLLIYFRHPNTNISFIVMCQVFIAFGGGTLVICEQMTVMAVSTQQNIPAILAFEFMIANIGSSIGSAIAAAMWTGLFPVNLAKYLPASALPDLQTIYGDLTVQSSYAIGSPERDGINKAYGETQKLMCVAATCLYATIIVWVSLWREINVKGMKQTKGLTM
ncbi:siderophore iron transporter-like protein mirB [Aureobasidium sp. EXF-12298]|nr:siderophore iron transporter-like protein mirB [Aureobasidium sp. EXF-12298]KAI4766441.1 siderophore iron transporter-like protein mirB [Aureobasidium sp. EXF-12344]KAI4783898.1 siderophore iron transporter-like protein mirB [Aureobasidium sp. EXF-3400]